MGRSGNPVRGRSEGGSKSPDENLVRRRGGSDSWNCEGEYNGLRRAVGRTGSAGNASAPVAELPHNQSSTGTSPVPLKGQELS